MVNEKKINQSIYVDSKNGSVIIAQKKDSNSYIFYATTVEPGKNVSEIEIDGLKPISDIFDYIDKNNIDINVLAKKMPDLGGKRRGK